MGAIIIDRDSPGRVPGTTGGRNRTMMLASNNDQGIVTTMLLATTDEHATQVTLQLFTNSSVPVPTISLTEAQLGDLQDFLQQAKPRKSGEQQRRQDLMRVDEVPWHRHGGRR